MLRRLLTCSAPSSTPPLPQSPPQSAPSRTRSSWPSPCFCHACCRRKVGSLPRRGLRRSRSRRSGLRGSTRAFAFPFAPDGHWGFDSTAARIGFPLPISALNGERVRVRGRRLLECVAAPDAFFPLRPLTLRSYAACATGPLPVLAKVLDGESECTLLFENLTGNAKRFS